MLLQDLPPPPPVEAVADETAASKSEIIVTASRTPRQRGDVPDAVSQIGSETAALLGPDQLGDLVRLLPSTALSQTGPVGTQSQIRIRGAEANHTLLFIDGIKANDPAAGNEARFELLSGSLGDAIELTRGPQSALWGSEAIGGVVGISSVHTDRQRVSAEIGSNDYRAFSGLWGMGNRDDGMTLSIGGQRSDGVDSFGANGEKDGYHNIAARFAGSWGMLPVLSLDASAFAIDANSEFDGYDPVTFLRADTLDESDNRLGAGRLALRLDDAGWNVEAESAFLASANRNSLAGEPVNRTSARRWTGGAQASRLFELENTAQRLTFAIDREVEWFRARDTAFGGFTDQDRDRSRTAMVAEWQMSGKGLLDIDLDASIRHDRFSDFSNATSLSAGARIPLGEHLAFAANYGEGIAQPSFFDLYGFFPGSFVGNPALGPEKSRGMDIGLRFGKDDISFSAAYFRQDLRDEIVDIFDFATFTSTTANGDGKSKRSGVELEAGWTMSSALELSANYSFLDATGPEAPDGSRLRETRRPKHRAAIFAAGVKGKLGYGASIAFVGMRFDDDFDRFPAERVRLKAYALVSARLAYDIGQNTELSLRGSNLLGSDYQDVVGYHAQGRAVTLGISFAH